MAGVRVIIEQMFIPGLISIVTDAFGIAIIAHYAGAAAAAYCHSRRVLVNDYRHRRPHPDPGAAHLCAGIPETARPYSSCGCRNETAHQGWENRFADWLGPWIIGKGRYIVIAVSCHHNLLFLLLVREADCRRCAGGLKPALPFFPLQPGQRTHQSEPAAHQSSVHHAGG